MNRPQLRALLQQVHAGAIDPDEAEGRLIEFMREFPYEDLGFARVDHHRALRQGFPEVVLGTGKSPAQIAAIAGRIVGRGHSLLVTRTDETAFDAVRAVVPEAAYNCQARAITLKQND